MSKRETALATAKAPAKARHAASAAQPAEEVQTPVITRISPLNEDDPRNATAQEASPSNFWRSDLLPLGILAVLLLVLLYFAAITK